MYFIHLLLYQTTHYICHPSHLLSIKFVFNIRLSEEICRMIPRYSLNRLYCKITALGNGEKVQGANHMKITLRISYNSFL